MNFLGVKISEVDLEKAREKVREFLGSSNQHKIFTPNPEMIVKAQKDKYFQDVLNSGDLNLCDGKGLEMFTKIKRIPGIDFMLEVCKIAAEKGTGVYLLGSGRDEVVKKTAENLQKQFPGLKIVGYDKGPVIEENCHSEHIRCVQCKLREESLSNSFGHGSLVGASLARDDTVAKINACNPDILFVAFGMGKQEKWIHENLSKMPSVKIAMGVGGSFDYISGKAKRAPLFLRKVGLEWMYRLFKQSSRIWRILNATVRFCYLIIKNYIYEKKI